jgi:TrpR-related protein YerC/YecD
MNNLKKDLFNELIATLVGIKNKTEMAQFMKDLCTPQELKALSERWQVCRLLHKVDLSYREINDLTGVSLATITRVARFLKNEPHNGYRSVLNKKKSN